MLTILTTKGLFNLGSPSVAIQLVVLQNLRLIQLSLTKWITWRQAPRHLHDAC